MKILVVLVLLAISPVAFAQSVFNVVGQPTIVKNFTPWTGHYVVSSTFSISILAVEEDLTFDYNSITVGLYRDGVKMTSPDVSFAIGYQTPSSGVVRVGLAQGQLFKLTENNQVTFNVTPTFAGPSTNPEFLSPAAYAIGIESVSYISSTSATRTVVDSMAGLVDWRTAAIQLNPGDINVTVIPESSTVSMIIALVSLCLVVWVRHKRTRPAVFSAC